MNEEDEFFADVWIYAMPHAVCLKIRTCQDLSMSNSIDIL